MIGATGCSTTTSPRKSSGRARRCRACVQECPVSIDQLDVINELRRNLVLTESRFPEELQPAFESLERNGSPWAFQPGRPRDAGPRDSTSRRWPSWRERGERPDVLFWVGCMGSFDDRAKKITVAFARILQGRAASASRSSARKRSATAIPRAAWATSTSTRCSRRTRSRRSTATR